MPILHVVPNAAMMDDVIGLDHVVIICREQLRALMFTHCGFNWRDHVPGADEINSACLAAGYPDVPLLK
jgi:hypothetical protein